MTFVTRNVVDRFGHIFTLITIIAVPVLLASTPLLWFGFRDVIFLFDESGLLTDIEGLTGSLIWQAVAALVVTFAGYALMFSSVTNLLSAEEHTWREGLIGGLNGTPRVLAFGVLSLVLLFVVTIMISVFVALVPALGAVFVLLLFGLFAWYWVRTAVAFTHSSLRQPGFGLKHSFALTRGSAMALLGRMILLASIAVMVQILVSIVTGPFLGSGVEAGDRRVAVGDVLGTDPAAFMLAQILGAFGGLFAVSLWAAAMLAIFRDLHRES